MTDWQVNIHKNAVKRAAKMPKAEQRKFGYLIVDLSNLGPVLPHWQNYSKLGDGRYHCHLSYKWVACWEVKNKTVQLIDVTYAGSREDAPYA